METLTKTFSVENVINTLKAEERITADSFKPFGELSENELNWSKSQWDNYKSHWDNAVELFKEYFTAYYTNTADTADLFTPFLDDENNFQKALHTLGLAFNATELVYIVKQLNAVMHGIKTVKNNETETKIKTFTAGNITGVRIRNTAEKVIGSCLRNGFNYAESESIVSQIYHRNGIHSLVKKALKQAQEGREKGMNNTLEKIKDKTINAEYTDIEKKVKAAFIKVEKSPSETAANTELLGESMPITETETETETEKKSRKKNSKKSA